MAANIHPVPGRERHALQANEPSGGCKVRGTGQVAPILGAGELRARARLRLLVGMRLLERLDLDPSSVGQRLPSIRAVAGASGVHRNTVAAVYADLACLGLIRCEEGSGSFASRPSPGPSDMRSRMFHCGEPELARLLCAEVGLNSATTPLASETFAGEPALLHPLDLAPTADATLYPVAPVGETLVRLRSLRRGSTAIVVSKSPSVRRLMRSALRAVHGASIGVVSLDPDAASPDLIAQRTGDVPAILFHDAGWSQGCCGITSCAVRLLTPGTNKWSPTGTPDRGRSHG